MWISARNLRNILSHNDNYAVISENSYKEFSDEVDKIMNPKNALTICSKNPYTARENNYLSDIIHTMHEKNFTNVPVVNDNNEVIGIFSSYTLFLYFERNNEIIIESNRTNIKNLKNYLGLHDNPDMCYDFISKNASISSVVEKFNKHKNKKLSAILVTESGKLTEKLLGIITSEDLIKSI